MDNLILIYGISETFPHNSKAFKQLQLQSITSIPREKPDMEQIVSASVKAGVTKIYTIATSAGHSCEGQILTGRKLIVEGKINIKIEYTACLPDQPIHGAHFSIPFSSFIVLGKDLDCFPDFLAECYIEDIYVRQLDKRTDFINIVLLLNAVPSSKI